MFWKQPNCSSQNTRVQQQQQHHSQQDQKEKFGQAGKRTFTQSPSISYPETKPPQILTKNHHISTLKSGLTHATTAGNSHESEEQTISRILPPDFETTIRQLEITIEANPDIKLDKIKELIMLYTLAVEYYDSNNDDKFIYYKNKIVYLHKQDNVIKAMNKNISPVHNSNQSSSHFASDSLKKLEQLQQLTKLAETRDKIKGLQEQAVEGVTVEDVIQIMDNQDINVLEQEMVIEKDLKKQTNHILKRLNQRMKTKTKCSSPFMDHQNNIINAGDNLNIMESIECHLGDGVIQTNDCNYQHHNNHNHHQVKRQIDFTTRQATQKLSHSAIDNIVSNFIADKKQSLSEEKKLKIDLIEFEYEKLLFQLEKNSTMLTEEEQDKIERDKYHKILLVEEEFSIKEQQEIDNIKQKYSNKPLQQQI